MYRDLKNTIDTAFGDGFVEGEAKGRAEGLAKGLAEGETKGMLETAKKFKQVGASVEMIMQVTGLSEEEISKL